MSVFGQDLFSPLGREYCVYFYYLTILAAVFFVLALVHAVYSIAQGERGILDSIVYLAGPFLLYFNNRLLYSMCVN